MIVRSLTIGFAGFANTWNQIALLIIMKTNNATVVKLMKKNNGKFEREDDHKLWISKC